jgi:hypothetical protein
VRWLLAIALAAGAPATHHTGAGTKTAREALLTAADLGKGWSSTPSTQQGVRLTCAGHNPSARGILETGAASSPAFGAAQTGPFVQQNASVYASVAQANAWWRRAVTPSIVRCVQATLAALAARGIKISVTSAERLRFPAKLPHTDAYRVVAAANGKKLYFDVVLLGAGRTITNVTISSFLKPVPAAFEQALATLVVRKLGGPPA